MNLPQTLQRITTALAQSGIDYMLTGSFAGVYYGSPRSTQDIDLVIAPKEAQLRAFVKGLPDNEYYVDLDAALEALQRESMFNVIDVISGWKIDMIIRKSRAFSQQEFLRRQLVDLQGVSLFVPSAEDIVIAKLEWSKLAQSQRQLEDVAAILRVQRESMDQSYLEKWIRELSLDKQWDDASRASET